MTEETHASTTGEIPPLDWPGALPHERALWERLGPEERERARRRLEAVLDVERGGGRSMASAAAAVGMARSAFFTMRDRWRDVPSVLSLGMGLRPVKTRASKRGAEFKQMVMDAIKAHLTDPARGTNDVLQAIERQFPVGLAKTTVLAWVDEVRRSSPMDRVVGRELSLDLSLIDLLDPSGRPHAVVCAVDVGARLVLGAGLVETGMNAYVVASMDGARRLGDLPLGIFELAPELQSFDLQLASEQDPEMTRFARKAVTAFRMVQPFLRLEPSIPPFTRRPRGWALTRATDGWLGGLRLGAPLRRSDEERDDEEPSANGEEAQSRRGRRGRGVTDEVAKALLSAAMDDYVKEVRATLGPSDDARDRAARAVLRNLLDVKRSP